MSRAALLALVVIACGHPPAPAIAPPQPEPVVAPPPAPDPDAPLVPLDLAVRTGTLPNGITYFITDGAARDPSEHASGFVGLAVRAGSLDETDAQTGAAHLLVHLVTPLLGDDAPDPEDLAETTFDGTTYTLTLGDEEEAHAIERDAERRLALLRKVIDGTLPPLDATRDLGHDLGVVDPVIREWVGTRRETHPPLAVAEHYAALTRDDLAAFRRTWYRPDRIAVIVAGDFDPPAMHRVIEKLFGSIPAATTPAPTRPPDVAPAPARIAIHPDPASSSFHLTERIPHRVLRGERGYRASLIDRLLVITLSARLHTLDRNRGRLAYAFLPRSEAFDLVRLDSMLDDAGELWRLARELARLAAHGLTPAELVAGVKLLPIGGHDDLDDSGRLGALAAWFIDGIPYPSVALDEVTARLAGTITADDLVAAARADFTLAGRALDLQWSRQESRLTEVTIAEHFAMLASASIEPWDQRAGARPLIPAPAPGTITATRAERGLTMWTLGNGARVVVRPTQPAAHGHPGVVEGSVVELVAFGSRGWARLPAARALAARDAPAIVTAGGLGDVPGEVLAEVLLEHDTRLDLGLDATGHAIRVARAGLRLGFELLHLAIAGPRRDPDAFAAWRAGAIATIPPADRLEQDAWFAELDSVEGRWPRPAPSRARYEGLALDDVLASYRDLVGDVAHTTFAITGPVTADQVKPFVETYLASLPAGATRLTSPPRAIPRPTLVPPTRPVGATFDLVFVASPASPGFVPRDLDVLVAALAHRIAVAFAARAPAQVTSGVGDDGRWYLRMTGQKAMTEADLATCEHALATLARAGPDRDDLTYLEQRFVATSVDERAWLDGIRAGLDRGRDPVAVDAELLDPTYLTARLKPALIQATARRFGKPAVRIIYPVN